MALAADSDSEEDDAVTEVWYCEGGICHACTTDECLGDCFYVASLKRELPVLILLM